ELELTPSPCPIAGQVTVTCKEYTYKCRNGRCISKQNPECDGEQDCEDNSDEDNCTPKSEEKQVQGQVGRGLEQRALVEEPMSHPQCGKWGYPGVTECPMSCSADCGIRSYTRKSRIVGGQNSDVGEWPWQVSLHVRGQGHICGASLVSESWLVSAAHCFQQLQGIRYVGPAGVIKRIISHPYFNDYTYDYDIAVVELQTPATFSSFIQPICLPDATHSFPVGKDLWVTGWGATAEGGGGASILQKAEIRLINQTVCNQLLTDQLTPRMMCVGILTGGVDACQGDSGGPLVSVEPSSRMFLAGVVSWGDGCAQRNKPGVYSRLTSLRDWSFCPWAAQALP
uniref:Peptidase S1 domain-containing protein n=1 Tax=Amazona collaria TaxID=241587 RepID=A0A8B9FBV2_9PSIT